MGAACPHPLTASSLLKHSVIQLLGEKMLWHSHLLPLCFNFFEELFNVYFFCTDLGAALLEEQISALKEALATKQAAVQELGKDLGVSIQFAHLSPSLALILHMFFTHVTPGSPRIC